MGSIVWVQDPLSPLAVIDLRTSDLLGIYLKSVSDEGFRKDEGLTPSLKRLEVVGDIRVSMVHRRVLICRVPTTPRAL